MRDVISTCAARFHVAMNARMTVRFLSGSELLTAHSATAQSRPPEPIDVVRSTLTSEHEPIDYEPTKTAIGVSGVSGGSSWTGPDAFASGQHEQSEYAQCGLSLSASTVTLSPGTHVARWSSDTVSELDVVQRQVAAEASGKSISSAQANVAP